MEKRTLSAYVADQLRELIMRGVLPPGDQLPSLRRLAAHLGISVPTLREAFSALAYLGLLEIQHGAGCFVARRPGDARSVGVNLYRATPEQLARLRRMLEPEAAGMVAEAGDHEKALDIRLLAGERQRLARSLYPREFAAADAAFHRYLVKAAQTPIVADLHRRVIHRLMEPTLPGAAELADRPDLDRWHRDLADAIGRGDRWAAAKLATVIVEVETAIAIGDDRTHPPRAGPIA